MEKIKNYLSSLGRTKIIIYSLITALLIGGGIYLTQEYLINKNPSEHILKVIPKESAFVMSFTPANFLAKMDIEDLMTRELGKDSKKNVEKADLDVLEDLFEDPSSSGIDLLTEVFAFHSHEDEHYFCISAGVRDDKKFGKFIKNGFKELGLRIKIKEKDNSIFSFLRKNNYNYFTEDNIGIVWDDDKFIFMIGTTNEDDLKDHMEKLMTLKEKDRITSNKIFNKFYENRRDVSIWTSTELLDQFDGDIKDNLIMRVNEVLGINYPSFIVIMNIMNSFISSEELMKICDDNIITYHMNFGDGELTCSSSFIPNKDLQDFMSKYLIPNLFDQEFNKEILKFTPENNLALLSSVINLDAIKKYIGSDDLDLYMNDMLNTFGGSFIANINGFGEVNTTIQDSVVYYNEYKDYEYNYHTEEYEAQGGYDYKYITKDTIMTMPLFSVIFDMKDSKFLEETIIKEGVIDITYSSYDGYYSFDVFGMDMFMDIEKNILMLTNDRDAIRKFENGGYRDNLSSSNQITNNISYAYLNLDIDKYSILIDEYFGGKMNDIWEDLFESMEIKPSHDDSLGIMFSAEFKISFKDKDQNVLQTLYELL